MFWTMTIGSKKNHWYPDSVIWKEEIKVDSSIANRIRNYRRLFIHKACVRDMETYVLVPCIFIELSIIENYIVAP